MWSQSPPGSPPGPPAPRTSTRSTPSRSKAPSTSKRSRAKPSWSWTPPSGDRSQVVGHDQGVRVGAWGQVLQGELDQGHAGLEQHASLDPAYAVTEPFLDGPGHLLVGERRPGARRHLDVRQPHQDRQQLVAEPVEELEPLVPGELVPCLVRRAPALAHALVLRRQHALGRAL